MTGDRSLKGVLGSVSVDPRRCQGHAFCERLAPEVFEVGVDDGLSHVIVLSVADELLEDAFRAEEACPEQAITVSTRRAT
jgi:ferredoxin